MPTIHRITKRAEMSGVRIHLPGKSAAKW